MKKKQFKYFKEISEGLGLVINLGATMVVCILVFFFVGLYIDKKFKLGGIAIIIFTILGIASGAFTCYKMIKKNEDKK